MQSNLCSNCRRAFKKRKLSFVLAVILGYRLLTSGTALALPQGGVVTNGTATISQSGTVTNINQSTNKAAINWQSFSTKPTETVNFNQPSASSITLNRVIGNEKSVLEGALNANGKVFLINSNGVLFTKGSTVNTAGLVASTLNLTDEDFNAGNYVFKANGSTGSIINLGTITVKDGGYVALLGNSVSNQGVITATKGTVSLNSGDKIILNFNGDSLVSVTIDEGTLNALVENKEAIYADGGSVILTAKAADDLLSAQVNNSGLIQARTIGDLKGNINLHAYGGTATISGTLDASAPTSGDGGSIETSGNTVKIADGAIVTTKAAYGKTGTWLIAPDGFTIGAGGDITGSLLGTLLGYNNITLSSTDGSGSDGNINVNQAVTWSADTTLTLNATKDININKAITATGTNAGLVMNYGGNYHILTPASYSGVTFDANGNPVANIAPAGTEYASITLSGSNASLKINGNSYTLIHSMTDLAALDDATGTATGYFALAQNLDATTWSSNNTGAASVVSVLSGTLAGLGHTISNLTLNAPSANYVGLIGKTSGTTNVIRDLGVVQANITGYWAVGALLGASNSTSISQAYSTGTVSGKNSIGGLVGAVESGVITISDSYSDADITVNAEAGTNAGGLIGYVLNDGVITNSHATGNVAGTTRSSRIGGLVGGSSSITVSNSYATGDVTTPSSSAYVGGLIGYTSALSATRVVSVANSFATGNVTGGTYIGGLIGAINTLTQSTYKSAVSTVNNSYATGNVTATGGGGAGGLIGYAVYTKISNSHASGDVRTTYAGTISASGSGIGGLVGYLKGSITNSYATGNVTGNGHNSFMGGLAGIVDGTITGSHATGYVMNGGVSVGGLAGRCSTITDSWASGNVSGIGTVGGLVGSGSVITNSWASGNVSGGSDIGGLAGFAGDGAISNSYATGNVTGTYYTGGLVGKLSSSSITNSYASGITTGTDTTSTGGLVGYAEGDNTLSNNYWNSAGQGNAVGKTESGHTTTSNNSEGLTNEQFEDIQYYRDGTIDQVLADRAATAAYRADASHQAGSTMGQTHQDQDDQTKLFYAGYVEQQRQPSIDNHIVYADSADYSADIKAINADGVEFDLEDNTHTKKK